MPGEGRFRVEERIQGPSEWRAGSVVGWGCSACAARFFGGRDDALGAAQRSPQKPPHGAEHPHPTPPARDAAWTLTSSLHQKSRPLVAPKPPDRNELQFAAARHRREAEQAPAASESLGRPEARAVQRRPQGAPAQLETSGFGHASPAKPPALECLPETCSLTTTFRSAFPRPPGRVDAWPTPTH